MMKKLLVLCLVASACASAAIVPRTADYTCNRLNPAEFKYECLREVKGRFVDEFACGVIDRYESSGDTLYGMRVIAGGRYQIEALDACDRYTQSTSTNDCLWATKDKWFDLTALRACDRIQDANETTRCFWAIGNCNLSSSQIAECDAYATAQDTTACFRYHCQ